ncbi:hypothetical protein K443DRAFT_93617 [Laccaria amethystina LaAM-08-1]|uniref:Uncharacterized protein n=1 Tax=Laccaria amethystina LaAM-08-1 TaxID=1095629 RepID=A0A0C9XR92_9AGAR|nr:hypothetical protein K443DRAFT_93617 [Laccaria amethystina LaAM-08-1]
MLVLQILTAALTISFAKANPVAIDVRNWEVPTADGNLKRGELVAASHASHYAEYIPTATETSLTRNYYEKRATCLEQFVWYCGIPAGACMTFVANPPSPLTVWSFVPCAIAAVCGSVALVLGALCCNGIIQHCNQPGFASTAASTNPVTGSVMSALNGGAGENKPFTRASFRNELNSFLKSKGSKLPSDNDFNSMYNNFLSRAFCSFGPGEGGSSCQPTSMSREAVRSLLLLNSSLLTITF